ncbi:porphobilinogen deaminase [Polymorphobacter glacialis]|uniref:Porphobilinogen deaminase n=1 Tax=Sandarakinorhabdus glacialis TaxID=1614636 RepID=A0A916ZRD3_9SPHN|nr:hydroxymethylbilane synthase [Polymorphobacter glacialis]GGE10437.1 porphobilinogen deaminase [Polymorphobacter glacialis]
MTAPAPASFKLGTRGSPLALVQARLVAAALTAAHGWGPEVAQIVAITTTGDRVQDRPLAEIGGKALWTKELDAALIDGRIDCGVHSMKDVETQLRDGIALLAMLPRADVRERLIGAESIDALPHGARVGTSSPRRTAQLLSLRPDLRTETIRGNVATRLAKVGSGELDATILAAAGLDRLGYADGATLSIDVMLPASAQGAIGITAREGDWTTAPLLAAINDINTFSAVSLERGFLGGLGGSCHSPVAALATIAGGRVYFRAEIMTEDGTEIEQGGFESTLEDAPALVAALAADMLADASPALRSLFSA